MIARRPLLAAAALGLMAPGVRAQSDYPNKPVRIIVPFPPGQAADIATRLIADELSRRWPQRVVVENRGGGAGVPALEAGARSPADGYTLTAGTSGTLGINPGVIPRLPYDSERDFAAISNIAMVPLIIIAHPSFPAHSVEALIAKARAEPGKVDVASAGPASSQHMAAELFANRAGIQLNIVHYRGSGPAVTDLVAGNVPVMFDSVASALPHIRSGRARALGVTVARPVPQLPEVPAIAQSGIAGYEAAGWTGLVAPTGTPPEVLQRINADVVAILREPAIVQRIGELGMIADPGTPAEFGAFVSREVAKWREVARLANVRLDG
ncbi:Bug family tripartite tricarboxylate transporter substrate binding protein [Plastoroseomonas hellenica]|uniref:Bug family tripartite tricarboxylate transporter substrate binding protein n=1 Tax=Plastoroseomonas hellenica TaxID=2687306 RepID=UPI001BA994FA|nr:tripartite tricarboxylate transporter substrate binding protein [Plastoroseomonas hellenica]MBR0643310.1 tripartite tricarboxylate transporter substrate binding protein [Plastoroseomonas hellenica]